MRNDYVPTVPMCICIRGEFIRICICQIKLNIAYINFNKKNMFEKVTTI